MNVNEIKRDVIDDTQLTGHLKDLHQQNKSSSDQIKLRLTRMIENFLK